MGSFSMWHWLMLLVVGLLLFGGKGKISDLMGDVAKGIKSFKKGMAEDEDTAKKPDQPQAIGQGAGKTIDAQAKPVPHTAGETSKVG
jgi:sec-independent protein translocase protein TatA